jgi:hypothetical protein
MSTKNRNRFIVPATDSDVVVTTADTEVTEPSGEENVAQEPPAPETPQESLVEKQVAPQVVEVATPKPVAVSKAASKETTKPEGFTPVFKVELDLSSYAEAMDKTKAINPEEGGRWQYSLYNTIRGILNASSQEVFNQEWNTLLAYFNKNKDGIFNENFIFRFPEQWTGSATEFTLFRRVLYTIIQTADPKARKKALVDINMAMVSEGMTEAQRNNLFTFYQV